MVAADSSCSADPCQRRTAHSTGKIDAVVAGAAIAVETATDPCQRSGVGDHAAAEIDPDLTAEQA